MNKKLLLGAMAVSIVTPSVVATADLVSADEKEQELETKLMEQEELVPVEVSKEVKEEKTFSDNFDFETLSVIRDGVLDLDLDKEFFEDYKELNLYLFSGSNIKQSLKMDREGNYKIDLSQFDLVDGVKIVSESITENEKEIPLFNGYSIDSNRDIKTLITVNLPQDKEYVESEIRGDMPLTLEQYNKFIDKIDTYNEKITEQNKVKPEQPKEEVENKPVIEEKEQNIQQTETKPIDEEPIKEETKTKPDTSNVQNQQNESVVPSNDVKTLSDEEYDELVNTYSTTTDNVTTTSSTNVKVYKKNLKDSSNDDVLREFEEFDSTVQYEITSSQAKHLIDNNLLYVFDNNSKKIKSNITIFPATEDSTDKVCKNMPKNIVIGDDDYTNIKSKDKEGDGVRCQENDSVAINEYWSGKYPIKQLGEETTNSNGQEMLPQTNTTKSSAFGMGIGAMLLGIGGALGIRRNKKQDTLN